MGFFKVIAKLFEPEVVTLRLYRPDPAAYFRRNLEDLLPRPDHKETLLKILEEQVAESDRQRWIEYLAPAHPTSVCSQWERRLKECDHAA